MAKELTEQIKDALSGKKAIVGSKQTIKYLKLKQLKVVIVSTNCPADIKKDIQKYTEIAGIKLENFEGTSKQLGVICGKPFPIAVISIK
ncbi:MAG: 50S ribosomal protein L30e [Candidatus Aenigmarchaeota archaeon]|nr:50S ribosomal protein L30e [Candidatus Aenigmarchaeota archaeon]